MRVVVYVGPSCSFCARAKRLLSERGIPFEEIDVAADEQARAAMIEASGRRTVPQVFIDGDPIGGYSELEALDGEGKLAALIEPGTGSAS